MSILYWGHGIPIVLDSLVCWVGGEDSSRRKTSRHILPSAALGAAGLLCFEVALPASDQLVVHQDSSLSTGELLPSLSGLAVSWCTRSSLPRWGGLCIPPCWTSSDVLSAWFFIQSGSLRDSSAICCVSYSSLSTNLLKEHSVPLSWSLM